MTLGLGIITYNREQALKTLLNSLKINGILDLDGLDVVVCDDSSSNYDVESLVVDKYKLPLISTSKNLGVVYNKNNALYNLFDKKSCDNVLLIEDDVICISSKLIPTWDEIISIFNHVSYLHPYDFKNYHTYDNDKVYLTSRLTAQAMGISRRVFHDVGYFNPIFYGYGYGHTEYSERALRLGYGGKLFKYYALKGYIQPNEIFSTFYDEEVYNSNMLKYLDLLNSNKINIPKSDVELYLS